MNCYAGFQISSVWHLLSFKGFLSKYVGWENPPWALHIAKMKHCIIFCGNNGLNICVLNLFNPYPQSHIYNKLPQFCLLQHLGLFPFLSFALRLILKMPLLDQVLQRFLTLRVLLRWACPRLMMWLRGAWVRTEGLSPTFGCRYSSICILDEKTYSCFTWMYVLFNPLHHPCSSP